MSLFDPFANGARDPTVQRLAELVVLGDNPMTPALRSLVDWHYSQFRMRMVSALPGLHVHDVRLEDGSRIRIESNNNLDQVLVTPAGGARVRYELLPAFWLNAPANGDPLPDPVNSATWAGMPLNPDQPPTQVENFWRKHPGNMTWYDSREDSLNKGLVLSWWSVGKTRYGAHIFSPWGMAKTTDAENYEKLFCNGVVIGELGQSVWSACIGQVDGEDTVIVITANATMTYVPGDWYAEGYGGQYSDPSLSSQASQRNVTLKLHHAKMPASFRNFEFQMLEFTEVATKSLTPTGSSFAFDGKSMRFGGGPNSPNYLGNNPIKFNASGTQGVIQVEGYSAEVGSAIGSDDTYWVSQIYIDPATGDLYIDDASATVNPAPHFFFVKPWWWSACNAALLAAGSGASMADTQTFMSNDATVAYDYEGDTKIAAVVTNAGSRQWYYSTKHGVLASTDTTFGGPTPHSIAGDLRADYLQFVRRYTTVDVAAYLGGALAFTSTRTPGSVYERTSIGFEGCDSSFDGRLIVDRSNGGVRVFADGEDITADLTEFDPQQLQYPVLCGPLSRLDGTPTPARQYVAGEPP